MTSNEPQTSLVDKTADGITTITINRPHRRNAIDGPTAKKLTEALLDFEHDTSQKVCILYGAHGTFCSGFDLHEVAKYGDANAEYKGPIIDPQHHVNGRNIGPIGPSRMQIKKPIISAVSGYAVAGGLELSLIGDIRVAEEDAIFGVFCRRFGVPLIDGGTVRLQAIIGLGRALDMILTGRGVAAHEALQMGLANRVVPRDRPWPRRQRLRSSFWRSHKVSFEDALSNEFENGVRIIAKESITGAAEFSRGIGRHGEIVTSRF